MEVLAQSLGQWASARAFQALGPPAERHGSWQVWFHRLAELDRFVSVGATGVRGAYEVELSAGAEDGALYTRRLVAQLHTGPAGFEDPAFLEELREAFERAMDAAERLS